MSAPKNKRAVIVGIFISLGILILLVTVMTLSGQKKSFVSAISLRSSFDDVGGLQKGNNVWYAGVKIGVVKEVEFAADGSVQVVLNVEERVAPFIKKDAFVKVGSDGLIGNKIMVIYGGTAASPPVADGDILQVKKAISTDEMMATLQDNNKNLLAITDNFKTISGRLANGEGTMGALLKDSSLYVHLQRTMERFQASAANTEELTSGIAQYVAQLEKPGTFSHEFVNDTTMMHNLKAAAGEIKAASVAVSATTGNLKQATESFNQKLNSPNNAAGVLLNDPATANELKLLIQNLESGSAKLDENMEALQHNFLFRGYFRKKAKREEKEKEAAQKNK